MGCRFHPNVVNLTTSWPGKGDSLEVSISVYKNKIKAKSTKWKSSLSYSWLVSNDSIISMEFKNDLKECSFQNSFSNVLQQTNNWKNTFYIPMVSLFLFLLNMLWPCKFFSDPSLAFFIITHHAKIIFCDDNSKIKFDCF